MTSLADAAAREVIDLHAFFVDAFTGRKRDFRRAEQAFSPDFVMVTPDGRRVNRVQVLDALAKARARPDFRIAIHDIWPISETAGSVLLHYIEEQYRDGETSKRVSVALFEAAPDAPCGVVWRYLQETWIAV